MAGWGAETNPWAMAWSSARWRSPARPLASPRTIRVFGRSLVGMFDICMTHTLSLLRKTDFPVWLCPPSFFSLFERVRTEESQKGKKVSVPRIVCPDE